MTIQEIKELLLGNGTFWACVILVVLSLVEVSKIKINPWTSLANFFGNIINSKVIEKIDNLQSEVNGVKDEVNNVKKEIQGVKQDVADIRDEAKEREATNRRARVLDFGDEILHDIDYSKEHWDSVLMDISAYENYCDDHPHYMNNVAKATIEHIKHMYQKHLEEDSFL
jgi:hypothetical protein